MKGNASLALEQSHVRKAGTLLVADCEKSACVAIGLPLTPLHAANEAVTCRSCPASCVGQDR